MFFEEVVSRFGLTPNSNLVGLVDLGIGPVEYFGGDCGDGCKPGPKDTDMGAGCGTRCQAGRNCTVGSKCGTKCTMGTGCDEGTPH